LEWHSEQSAAQQSAAAAPPLTPTLLPHILIGCRNEIFGLPILQSAFCSEDYAAIVNRGRDREGREGQTAECILLPQWSVNHWTVLSSTALREALRTSLHKALETSGRKGGRVIDGHHHDPP
jgi:hypothetical protein